MERENAWKKYDAKAFDELEALSVRYRDFLDNGKTERECADYAVALAEKNGYVSLESAVKAGNKLEPGAKLYSAPMGKYRISSLKYQFVPVVPVGLPVGNMHGVGRQYVGTYCP